MTNRTTENHTCPDCGNSFVQPFVCITCGAQKLYDETVRTQADEIQRLRSQLKEAHEAVWAMAEDGWLYCGVEGFSHPQQLANDYTEKYPRGVSS